MVLLLGCNPDRVPYAVDGGDGSSSSTSTSSSSTSSSSGSIPSCNNPTPIAPSVNDGGYGYFEDGVLACRRFTPNTYPWHISSVLVKADITEICTLRPTITFAIGTKEQLSGFMWGAGKDVGVDGNGGLDINIDLQDGQTFYGCVILPAKSASERACLLGCYVDSLGLNDDFLWGDTLDPLMGGTVIAPPVLEPLSLSPTPELAKQLNNDRLWLGIQVIGYQTVP